LSSLVERGFFIAELWPG